MTLRPIGHQPLLAALAEDPDQILRQEEIGQAEAAQLGDPEPGPVGQLQQRAIPPGERLLQLGRGEQRSPPPGTLNVSGSTRPRRGLSSRSLGSSLTRPSPIRNPK